MLFAFYLSMFQICPLLFIYSAPALNLSHYIGLLKVFLLVTSLICFPCRSQRHLYRTWRISLCLLIVALHYTSNWIQMSYFGMWVSTSSMAHTVPSNSSPTTVKLCWSPFSYSNTPVLQVLSCLRSFAHLFFLVCPWHRFFKRLAQVSFCQ